MEIRTIAPKVQLSWNAKISIFSDILAYCCVYHSQILWTKALLQLLCEFFQLLGHNNTNYSTWNKIEALETYFSHGFHVVCHSVCDK